MPLRLRPWQLGFVALQVRLLDLVDLFQGFGQRGEDAVILLAQVHAMEVALPIDPN